jgi:hypothetical protein
MSRQFEVSTAGRQNFKTWHKFRLRFGDKFSLILPNKNLVNIIRGLNFHQSVLSQESNL